MTTPLEQFQELLEDFIAVGEEVWAEAEAQADSLVRGGVRKGSVSTEEFARLGQNRDQITRYLVLQQTIDFMESQGMPQDEIDRVMVANGNGFSEADLLNMDNGIMPSREAIEAFRVRTLCAHYAFICDLKALEELSD